MATGQTHGGKGSATRPTDKKKYENNWDAIFGKKHNEKFDKKIDELFDDYFRKKKTGKQKLCNSELLKKEKEETAYDNKD